MPVTIQDLPDRIKKAKALNATDEQILESIRKASPTLLPQAQSLLKQSVAPTPVAEPSFVEKAARLAAPKSVEGFAQTLGEAAAATFSKDIKQAQESQVGLTDINQKLGQKIVAMKKLGQDTSRLERQYQENSGQVFDVATILPSTQKTKKQIAGEALGTLGTAALGASPAKTVAKRIGLGTLVGTGAGAKKALEEDKTFAQGVKTTVVGAATGAAVSGVLEGLGALISRSKNLKQGAANIYTKELQPPNKEEIMKIEKGFQTFGQEVANVTDDAGKPVYRGGYKTLISKAKNELEVKGAELMKRADDFADTSFTRDEVVGDLVSQLKGQYNVLTKHQLAVIKEEIKRVPRLMNPEELINTKRVIDGTIPDSAWTRLEDPALAFPVQVKYLLRDNARRLLNSKIPDARFQELNNRLSIAFDVSKLAATQLEKVRKTGIFSGGLASTFNNILQRTIFQPAITTRVSQRMLRAGAKTGQTTLRQAGRTGATFILNKLQPTGQ